MAIETTIWMKTSNPSKAMAPAIVTWGPWVATWSHCTSAAISAATETVAATIVPDRTLMMFRSSDDTSISASAPPSMISIGRMLR